MEKVSLNQNNLNFKLKDFDLKSLSLKFFEKEWKKNGRLNKSLNIKYKILLYVNCNNARLIARYVRKDYIIDANFKAWREFDRFADILDDCHEYIRRNYECEEYYDFNVYNDNTDFIELEANINMYFFIF